MSKKKRKWSDEYAQYEFTYIIEPDGNQRLQCTICDAKSSNSSLAPPKLKEHFLKMHGDGKYKNTTIAEFKIKKPDMMKRLLCLFSALFPSTNRSSQRRTKLHT